MLGEYISERLQIRLASAGKAGNEPVKHISMIHAQLMDINVFLQVLVESNLKAANGEANRFTFELPDSLRNFYC